MPDSGSRQLSMLSTPWSPSADHHHFLFLLLKFAPNQAETPWTVSVLGPRVGDGAIRQNCQIFTTLSMLWHQHVFQLSVIAFKTSTLRIANTFPSLSFKLSALSTTNTAGNNSWTDSRRLVPSIHFSEPSWTFPSKYPLCLPEKRRKKPTNKTFKTFTFSRQKQGLKHILDRLCSGQAVVSTLLDVSVQISILMATNTAAKSRSLVQNISRICQKLDRKL